MKFIPIVVLESDGSEKVIFVNLEHILEIDTKYCLITIDYQREKLKVSDKELHNLVRRIN